MEISVIYDVLIYMYILWIDILGLFGLIGFFYVAWFFLPSGIIMYTYLNGPLKACTYHNIK